MAVFNRDHLIIGALGFVLGSVVSTASITAVLMTQQKEEKVCPPVTAIVAPNANVEATPAPLNTTTPVTSATTPSLPINTASIKGLAGEQADQLSEEQQQLVQRKQLLESQLKDSNEILRLKEQQIKEMEAKLKQ